MYSSAAGAVLFIAPAADECTHLHEGEKLASRRKHPFFGDVIIVIIIQWQHIAHWQVELWLIDWLSIFCFIPNFVQQCKKMQKEKVKDIV